MKERTEKMKKEKPQKTKKDKPAYSMFSNILYIIKTTALENTVMMAAIIVYIICQAVAVYLNVIIPKLAVDIAILPDKAAAFQTLAAFALLFAFIMIFQNVAGHIQNVRSNSRIYRLKIMDKYLNCDYAALESAEGQNLYRKALDAVSVGNDYGTGPPCMIFSMVHISVSIITFFMLSGMLARLNPLIAAMAVVFSAINAYIIDRVKKYEYSRRGEYGDYLKKMTYLERASSDVSAGKDIRIFDMAGCFTALWKNIIEKYRALLWDVEKRHGAGDAVNAASSVILDFTAYAYLIYSAVQGHISASEFVLYLGVITNFSGTLRSVTYWFNRMNMGSIQVSDMREFLNMKDSTPDSGKGKIPDFKEGNIPKIEFRNVTFSYTLGSKPVLSDFNLTIEPGEKLAIVGLNGAGKTTIVKLMCGFYKPVKGNVLIGGVSTKDISKEDMLKLFSVVFQDTAILPFTIGENISMQPPEDTDFSRVWDALELADLMKKVRRYPKTMSEHMTKEIYDDGIALSGGEQQKLLMARAIYKNAPILIMDEPTAALDPIAESETYEKFHSISENKTAVYISHRLASTRFCDRIVLLADGCAAEIGSHDELMAQGGMYAEMYSVQSKYYSDNKNTDDEEEWICSKI